MLNNYLGYPEENGNPPPNYAPMPFPVSRTTGTVTPPPMNRPSPNWNPLLRSGIRVMAQDNISSIFKMESHVNFFSSPFNRLFE